MPHSKMSKRLQKKLYLGEFAVIGFEFSASLSDFDNDQFEGFFDALIEFIESRGLEIAGGGSKNKFSGYVAPNARYGATTEDDRTAIKDWLTNRDGVSDVVVEALSDAYYGE